MLSINMFYHTHLHFHKNYTVYYIEFFKATQEITPMATHYINICNICNIASLQHCYFACDVIKEYRKLTTQYLHPTGS